MMSSDHEEESQEPVYTEVDKFRYQDDIVEDIIIELNLYVKEHDLPMLEVQNSDLWYQLLFNAKHF